MGEYFRRWKRKAGCVTLVVACVFMAGWVRSIGYIDSLGIRYQQQLPGLIVGFRSSRGRFGMINTGVNDPCPHGWSSIPITAVSPRVERRMQFWFDFPYWLTVIPLMLLSTWLLFSKPRQQPSPAPDPINSNTGRTKRICLEQIKLHLGNIHGAYLCSDSGEEKQDT